MKRTRKLFRRFETPQDVVIFGDQYGDTESYDLSITDSETSYDIIIDNKITYQAFSYGLVSVLTMEEFKQALDFKRREYYNLDDYEDFKEEHIITEEFFETPCDMFILKNFSGEIAVKVSILGEYVDLTDLVLHEHINHQKCLLKDIDIKSGMFSIDVCLDLPPCNIKKIDFETYKNDIVLEEFNLKNDFIDYLYNIQNLSTTFPHSTNREKQTYLRYLETRVHTLTIEGLKNDEEYEDFIKNRNNIKDGNDTNNN